MSNLTYGQGGEVVILKRLDAASGSRYYCAPRLPEIQSSQDGSQVLEYLQIVRRHIISILFLALLGVGAGAFMSMMTPPMYRARTTLDIQQFNDNILDVKSPMASNSNDGAPAESYIQTELKILQSDSMIRRATEKLKKAPKPGNPGGRDESALMSWSKGLGRETTTAPPPNALDGIGQGLKVRPLGLTRIVEVVCDARDARTAAAFCNTLADEYIAQNSEARWQSTQQTGEWLSHQLEDLKRRLARSEEQLTQAAKATGALVLAEDQSLAQDKLHQLQSELSNAEAERVKRQSLYEMASSSPPEATELFSDGPAHQYQMALTDLKRQMAELSFTITPEHYKMQQVQSQVKVLQSALEKERTTVIDQLRSEYQAAQRRESLLTSEYNSQIGILSDQAAKAVQYNMLKREVESGRDLYQNILHRVEELALASAMRASTIRVVDKAVTPGRPYSPNWNFNCAAGFMGGTFLGVGLAFVRFRSNRSLQDPGQAPALLNVRELGVIPSAGFQGSRSFLPRNRFLLSGGFSGAAETATRLELATLHQRHSVLAESFAAAMNSLLFAPECGSEALKVVVVASPESGDGKTSVATNLAIALSQIDRRVLLMDGDLRQPRISRIFEMEQSRGLIELLTNPTAVGPLLLYPTYIPQLFVLPSGNRHAFESKLLHSAQMRDLMQRIRDEFDIVIIDSPPLVQFSDARVLARWADGVLLVFRSRRTTLELAMAAQRYFVEDGSRVVGTILNDWNPRHSTNFRSYRRTYSYAKPN